MTNGLISGVRSILLFAMNTIAFIFSLFSLAFAGTPGFVSLYGYMMLVGVSSALNLVAWWMNGERTKSALAVRMLVLFGFAALMGSLSLPTIWSTPYPYGWIAFTAACALLFFTFWRWKRDLTQFLEKKPDPESWRTAKSVIYQYGIPLTPFYVVLFGIFILAMCKFMLLTLPWFESKSGFFVLLYCASILIVGAAFVAGGIKLIRSVWRPHFPDKPYVWATSRGLNVADRFFIEWRDIVQISEDFGRHRAVIGAQIHTQKGRGNGPLVVPFANTTIDSKEALKLLQAMASENGVSLTKLMSPSTTKISEWAMRRAYRKNAELRQMTLDAIERLPKQITNAENDLTHLSAQIVEYENRISNVIESKALSQANLQKMRQVGGLKQYPEFPDTVRKTLESCDESIRRYQHMIQDVPRRKTELEKHIAFLSETLADWEDKKRRYMS